MFTMNYMLASYPNGLPSFLNDMGDSFAGETFDIFSNMDSEYRMKILQFPFAFYYNLQSCVTNNIYYVPAVPDSKMIL